MSELKLRVQRFNPESDSKPRFEEFQVPRRAGMTVLDAHPPREGLHGPLHRRQVLLQDGVAAGPAA